jgi:hypothetical protein
MDNFQRVGSVSNAHVGSEFEKAAKLFFQDMGVLLSRDFSVPIGVAGTMKPHKFDLGSEDPPILAECKSHTWTKGGNIPSAKLTVWNEAMYYFHTAPSRYRKIFFVLKDFSKKRNETLGAYYLRNYQHLVPDGVEFWEYDALSGTADCIH